MFTRHIELCKDQLETILSSKRSLVLTKEKFDATVAHLKNPRDPVDAHFKHWVKTKKFGLVDIPALELVDALVVPNPAASKIEGATRHLRVVHADQLYDITKQVHVDELKHAGYKKVMEFVQRHYYGVTRSYIQTFCKTCPTCQLAQPQITKPPLQPIIEGSFMARIQLDLIDMRHCPDGTYHYIAHFMDHFTKFHILFPLATKSADEVSKMFAERVLAYLGSPRIFHSDNGHVDQVMHALLKVWNRDVTFVNGRPRHSQSQGLVERGNQEVEKKLASMKAEQGLPNADDYPWSAWLPEIMFTLNSQRHETIKDTPYHLVFGCTPPAPLFPGATEHIINEEDLQPEPLPEPPQPSPEPLPEQPQPSPEPLLEPPQSSLKSQSLKDVRRQAVRRKAHEMTISTASKMSSQYNKRRRIMVEVFNVGDPVSIAVPKIDRSSTDLPRIPGRVVKVNGSKQPTYTVGTAFGLLKTALRAGDLQRYTGAVTVVDNTSISLREAANRTNPVNRFTRNSCKCTTACTTARCSCRKNNIACSTRCHGSRTCKNIEPPASVPASTVQFNIMTTNDIMMLNDPTVWLNDNHMSAASRFLRASFPHVDGLQDTVLQQNFSFDLPTSEYAQILHVEGNHWIVISTIDQAQDTVAVYDSLRSKPSKTTINLIARYNHSTAPKLVINIMNVKSQNNSHDCGVYALGFITALLHHQDPTTIAFVEPRNHLVQSLRSNTMAPFPTSTRTRTPKILHSITVDIFCSCRGIDTGTLMVKCDCCSEWYHADCLNIGKGDLKASKWLCYECDRRSKTNMQSKC